MLIRLLVIASTVPMLAGCSTLSSRVLTQPPGIHEASFRECLLTGGFFSPTALVGAAKADYRLRHSEDVKVRPTRSEYVMMPRARFLASTTDVLYADFFPHLQFAGGDLGREPDVERDLLNVGINRPYGENLAPPPYRPEGYGAGETSEPSERDRPDVKVNRFLDCYIAPVGHALTPADRSMDVDGDADLEGRLLRAHVLLALLASYGAELTVSHASSRQADLAARLLHHVRDAEVELRGASQTMNPKLRERISGKGAKAILYDGDPTRREVPTLRWYDNATRILKLFQVAYDTQVIDGYQSLDRATNLLTAFSRPTPGAFRSILQDALKGLASLQKVQLYGDAMLRDGRETLAWHRRKLGARNGTVFVLEPTEAEARWRLWDRRIAASCSLLAQVAKEADGGCIPEQAAMNAVFDPRWSVAVQAAPPAAAAPPAVALPEQAARGTNR